MIATSETMVELSDSWEKRIIHCNIEINDPNPLGYYPERKYVSAKLEKVVIEKHAIPPGATDYDPDEVPGSVEVLTREDFAPFEIKGMERNCEEREADRLGLITSELAFWEDPE